MEKGKNEKPSYTKYGLTANDLLILPSGLHKSIERCFDDWECDTRAHCGGTTIYTETNGARWLTDEVVPLVISKAKNKRQVDKWLTAVDARIEEQRKRAVQFINEQMNAVSLRLKQNKDRMKKGPAYPQELCKPIDLSLFIGEKEDVC